MVQGRTNDGTTMIEEAISPCYPIITLKVSDAKIESIDEFKNRNCIKVVCDLNDHVCFFHASLYQLTLSDKFLAKQGGQFK